MSQVPWQVLQVPWQVLQLLGDIDLRRLVCDDDQLSSLLLLPSDGASVEQVTGELCAMSDEQVANLTRRLLQELDVTALIDIVRHDVVDVVYYLSFSYFAIAQCKCA